MAKIGKKRSKSRRTSGNHKKRGGSRSTVRVSLHTIALLFPPQSLQRVYLHGRWQKTRGRNPSLRLSNQSDPRLAYAHAEELEGEYIRSVLSQRSAYNKWLWNSGYEEKFVQAMMRHDPPEQVFTCHT